MKIHGRMERFDLLYFFIFIWSYQVYWSFFLFVAKFWITVLLPFTFPHLIKLAMNMGTELAVNYFGLSVCQNRTYSSPSHFLLNLSRGVLSPVIIRSYQRVWNLKVCHLFLLLSWLYIWFLWRHSACFFIWRIWKINFALSKFQCHAPCPLFNETRCSRHRTPTEVL